MKKNGNLHVSQKPKLPMGHKNLLNNYLVILRILGLFSSSFSTKKNIIPRLLSSPKYNGVLLENLLKNWSHALGPQNHEKWGFSTPKIWVISYKNEGFGFPWCLLSPSLFEAANIELACSATRWCCLTVARSRRRGRWRNSRGLERPSDVTWKSYKCRLRIHGLRYIWHDFGCFLKWWYPQIIHFNRVFHYKPSILGYPYFWKHPFGYMNSCLWW